MKTKLLTWATGMSLFVTACENKETSDLSKDTVLVHHETAMHNDGAPSTKVSKFETINLNFDFKLTIGEVEDFRTFKTYSFLEISKSNQKIFVDSSLTEYEFGDHLYPIVLKIGSDTYELILEVNNRPNKNYLKRLFIEKNVVIDADTLPTFIGKSIDINKDGVYEYAGYWDESQVWGEQNSESAYNPILYYSITEKGLSLDSELTKERNELIYGRFEGYNYDNRIETHRTLAKFEKELRLLQGEK